MNKILLFEGAGWDKCDSCTDVGNCRIRTRIKNNDGEIIYLEMMGRKSSLTEQVKRGYPEYVGFVSHCHITDNDSSKYRKLELGTRIAWEKEILLDWVNKELDCSFDSLVVDNENVRVHDTKEPLCG